MENLSIQEVYLNYVDTYNSIIESMEQYSTRHKGKRLFSKMFIDTFNHQVSDFSNRVSNKALFSHFVNEPKEELESFRVKILKLANDLHAKSLTMAKGEL
nr:hypothetical protein [uncultured Fluviicola sp.]